MRKIAIGLLLASSAASASDSGVQVQLAHTSTDFSNMGVCAATIQFTIHSVSDPIKALELGMTTKNANGTTTLKESFLISTEDLEYASGKSWGSIFLESKELCGAKSWTLEVTKANLIFDDGHKENLLKLKRISSSNFKPMQIKFAN